MKIYYVHSRTGHSNEFTSVAAAKKYMKQLNKIRPDNAYGEIVWIDRRTGDWEPLGDIELKGNNKTALVHNGKLTRSY